MFEQKTIKREVVLQGRGLHSGHPVTLRLHPSNPDSGIVFPGGFIYTNDRRALGF